MSDPTPLQSINPLVHSVPFLGCYKKLDVKKMPFNIQMKKSTQRDANTARALAVVRFGHHPPARCHKATDRTDYNTLHRS